MHTVIIEGSDLQYFQMLTNGARNGNYGELRAVQLYVTDDGKLQLGTNGYTSEPFGRPNAPLVHPNETDGVTTFPGDEGDARNFPPEGSGNPYANVYDDDSPASQEAVLKHRIARLEAFARLAAERHGLEDLLELATQEGSLAQ